MGDPFMNLAGAENAKGGPGARGRGQIRRAKSDRRSCRKGAGQAADFSTEEAEKRTILWLTRSTEAETSMKNQRSVKSENRLWLIFAIAVRRK